MNRWTKVFLTALRIAVGWHFLYEGLWKVDSETGATSYATSWYTLQSSVGRLRDYYESNSRGGLDADLARADLWYDEIVKSFKARNKPLADDQKARLALLRDKVKLAAAGRQSPVVDFDWAFVRDETLKLAARARRRALHCPALPAGLDGTVPAVVPRPGERHRRHRTANRGIGTSVAGQSLPGDPPSL